MAYFHIPAFPQEGQRFAFVDREEQIQRLYGIVTDACNAVRAGNPASIKHCVEGPKGVGKSSAVVHLLRMLRDDSLIPEGFPPLDAPERWLVFRVSGKSIGSSEGLMQAMLREMRTDVEDEAALELSPIARALGTMMADAAHQVDETAALKLRWYHRLFRTKDAQWFDIVRKELDLARQRLDTFRNYAGGTLTRNEKNLVESTVRKGHGFQTVISGSLGYGGLDAVVKADIERARTSVGTTMVSEDLHMKVRIDATLMVDALNQLFRSTQKAKLPTILVLDDLDEVAAEAGVSYVKRAALLKHFVGPFIDLNPTVTIISLRSEYVTEDVKRAYPDRTAIPPLDCAQALDALSAWAVTNGLGGADFAEVMSLGRDLLAPIERLGNAVHTWAFLDQTKRLFETRKQTGSIGARLRHGLKLTYPTPVSRAIEALADGLGDAEVRAVANLQPIDRGRLPKLGDDVLATLDEEHGLFRPVAAADREDPRIVVDWLIALLAAHRLAAP